MVISFDVSSISFFKSCNAIYQIFVVNFQLIFFFFIIIDYLSQRCLLDISENDVYGIILLAVTKWKLFELSRHFNDR